MPVFPIMGASAKKRLLLDQLKFCWNSTPHARNAKTVYGERQEHGDTRIMVPRSICQFRKQRMHAGTSQDLARGGCFSQQRRNRVACAGSCLNIIVHVCRSGEDESSSDGGFFQLQVG